MRLVTTAGLFQDLWVASLYRGTKGYDTKASVRPTTPLTPMGRQFLTLWCAVKVLTIIPCGPKLPSGAKNDALYAALDD